MKASGGPDAGGGGPHDLMQAPALAMQALRQVCQFLAVVRAVLHRATKARYFLEQG